ncbi:hypothetical protein ABVV53_06860 [Novosphingobium sp. RD2P27]|uniref:Uncharacterized protein n=1 Tax=Novosphingobium kalidii TaxID=3230299 RepID=A0ABV2D016_9SPHN
MYIQRKTDVESFEEHRGVHVPSGPAEVEKLGSIASDDSHARALQYRLTEAFSETPEDEKLPIRQRVAVIAGATSALWLMIGAAVYAVI